MQELTKQKLTRLWVEQTALNTRFPLNRLAYAQPGTSEKKQTSKGNAGQRGGLIDASALGQISGPLWLRANSG